MYKSPLESYCAKKLDSLDIPFSYEQRTYELQESFKPTFNIYERYKKRGQDYRHLQLKNHKVRKITYTPDFVSESNEWLIVIEVKGHKTPQFQLRFKLFLKYLQRLIESGSIEANKVLVFVPRNRKEVDKCIDIIKDLINEQKEEPKSSD